MTDNKLSMLILSDLHFEYRIHTVESWIRANCLALGVDVLVLAGDICAASQLVHVLGLFRKVFNGPNQHIVYVPGNHEHWMSSRVLVREACASAEATISNVHCLLNRSEVILGRTFIGGTMWWEKCDLAESQPYWSDFHMISGDPVATKVTRADGTPDIDFRTVSFKEWVYEENLAFQELIHSHLKAGTKDSIVVTHMLPHEACVDPRWRDSPTNAFFLCDMSREMIALKPAAWIHGHTHASVFTFIEDTHIVCNPRGNEMANGSDENKAFDPNLTVVV